MKIAFEADSLIIQHKTGVSYSEEAIIKELLLNYKEYIYFFNIFARSKEKQVNFFLSTNCRMNCCRWVSYDWYRLLSSFIGLPYSLFFGKKADVYHFFNCYVPPFVAGKRVVTVHDMAFKSCPETVRLKTKILRTLNFKRSLKRADVIVTVSEFTKQELLNYYPEFTKKRIEVVPNGVSSNFFYKAPEIVIKNVKMRYKIEDEYFLYIGTLEPRKNLERLITAFAHFMHNRKVSPQLVIAGRKGWHYESIFERGNQLSCDEKIIFTGYVEKEDIPALLSGAIAFCFPSLYEGFGMPILEAMACGTPVITSDRSSLREIAGSAALLVNPLNVESIEAGIHKLYDDKNFREELASRGKLRILDYSWKHAGDKLIAIYKDLYNEEN
ncbi:MAG: glycosyltransferase family 4 protein [Treponema sp.]|jgi:glycosyltransferase involved in cell wall biosynthesis|nr:glycosyltransferase family 4 protein [Treponema sp.]